MNNLLYLNFLLINCCRPGTTDNLKPSFCSYFKKMYLTQAFNTNLILDYERNIHGIIILKWNINSKWTSWNLVSYPLYCLHFHWLQLNIALLREILYLKTNFRYLESDPKSILYRRCCES